jgi:ankyrin repeat protein
MGCDLRQAVNSGNFAAVKALLRHGRDVNQPTSYGSTPLHLAVALNNADLVRALLEADSINVDLASFDGNTPLHWAVWYGCAEV